MLGLGVGTPLAIMGALFHLFNHSIFKSLLFMNAGAVEDMSGTRDIRKMPGVISISPLTGYTNLIGSLSICGVPPLGGFWSKIIIIFACIQANRPALAFTAAAVSILTLGYYFKAMTPVIFGSGATGQSGKKKLPLTFALPLIVLALLSIFSILLLAPGVGRPFLGDALMVLVRGKEYATILTGFIK
jgi:multicomponent Na+:H+ antiporter subunit D